MIAVVIASFVGLAIILNRVHYAKPAPDDGCIILHPGDSITIGTGEEKCFKAVSEPEMMPAPWENRLW